MNHLVIEQTAAERFVVIEHYNGPAFTGDTESLSHFTTREEALEYARHYARRHSEYFDYRIIEVLPA